MSWGGGATETLKKSQPRTIFQKQDIRDIPEFLESLSNTVRIAIERLMNHLKQGGRRYQGHRP